jgi:hypothetical protein
MAGLGEILADLFLERESCVVGADDEFHLTPPESEGLGT